MSQAENETVASEQKVTEVNNVEGEEEEAWRAIESNPGLRKVLLKKRFEIILTNSLLFLLL